MDSEGLVVEGRPGRPLAHHKQPFALRGVEHTKSLLEAIRAFKPTALLGVAAQPGAFDDAVLHLMASLNERPIILPLSNPTSLSECTAKAAFEHTGGRCLFASGSPFPRLVVNGAELLPSQSNNAYIFPALGLCLRLCGCTELPEDAFLVAAESLASLVTPAELRAGVLFPPFSQGRRISARIAADVARFCVEAGLGVEPPEVVRLGGWLQFATALQWAPPVVSKL
jgi:malate dehydrogenase (oxaloacetate-decarboxylating)(NADP+)